MLTPTSAESPQVPETPQPVQGKAAIAYSSLEWRTLVTAIQAGDPLAMEQFYKVFRRGIRYYLARELGPQDMDDRLHDTFLAVVKAIQHGDIREPDRLMGFVRTVVRRQVAAYIEEIVVARHRGLVDLDSSGTIRGGISLVDHNQNPEQAALLREQATLLKGVLASLCKRDREILMRFYLLEQSLEQICREMALTETQFRLQKSRAKAKLGEIGQRRLLGNKAPRARLAIAIAGSVNNARNA